MTSIQNRPGIPLAGVVFDLFHTLVDPECFRPCDFDRADFTARCFGLDSASLAGAWSREAQRRMVDASRTIEQFLGQVFRAENRPWPPTRDLDTYYREVGKYQDMAILHPPAVVLDSLRRLSKAGLRLGLLSNAETVEVREIGRSPLYPLLDEICTSCDLGVAKPEPRAYRAVLDRLGLPAGSCAYVGDGGQDELRGAMEAGFGLVIMSTSYLPSWISGDERFRRSRQAHVTVQSFSNLVPLILDRARAGPGYPSGYVLRPGRVEDFPGLEWSWETCARRNQEVTQSAFCRAIRRGTQEFWVVEGCGEMIVGQIHVVLNSEDRKFADGSCRAYLCALEIHPDYRGRGLGRALMEQAVYNLKKRGYSQAVIGVDACGRELKSTYQRWGFDTVLGTVSVDPYALDENGRPAAVSPFALLLKRLVL